ncbi:MAG: AsnC family protein [Clostridia bacterium]|nr:AsnC family protein [Clostridia bacterium]
MKKDKKVTLTGLPPAQSLKEQYQKHDFTLNPFPNSKWAKDKSTFAIYKNVKKLSSIIFRETWQESLKESGMKSSPINFSEDDPLTLLSNQNQKYVVDRAADLIANPNEEQLESTINLFWEGCEEFLCSRYRQYAEEHNIDINDIDNVDDEELLPIVWEAVQEYLSQIYNYLKELQSVPEIIEILKSNRTEEDFNEFVYENHDKIDFERKWTHSRTKAGPAISLEDLGAGVDGDNDESKQEEIERKIWEAAGGRDEDKEHLDYRLLKEALIKCASDEKDIQIIEMRENSLTDEEIAKRLGFANHSTVAKRIAKLQERYYKKYKKG